ncbi:hypothetical protein GCM10009332_17160 [Shewanella gelidii]|uniref:Uncharacterized protein n=1 Tax=Shewanella gelidii TaxID=1642821 RepID=A0A917NBB2_9GAMM|nr:hypothetical protein GCM10009332_17160 [Shewanella gelidii]
MLIGFLEGDAEACRERVVTAFRSWSSDVWISTSVACCYQKILDRFNVYLKKSRDRKAISGVVKL